MKDLEGLHPFVTRLWVEKGFKEATPPQKKAISVILSGSNALIVSPTGTGKTEAAFLPVLSRMISSNIAEGVKLLYVTPLRTLNRDILSRLKWWTLRLGLRMAVRHGDTSREERRIQALAPPDILVTTPETLQLLIYGRRLREHLKALKWVIVDEVHEVADSKRGVQLSLLLERLKEILGRRLQIIGLSATVGDPEHVARLLVGVNGHCKIIYTPVAKMFKVKVVWPEPAEEDAVLAEKLFTSPELAARLRCIREIIETCRSALIFTNTRPTAEMLASRFRLWDERIPVYVHHGSLSQSERVRIEKMLREGRIKGVICTSSMELGIDIGHVDVVVQYNSPREVRRLVQRVGRSGHALGRVSKGVIIVGNSDDALESIVLVKLLEKEEVEAPEIPRKPLDVLAHELVGYALAERIRLDEAYNVFSKADPYRDLSLEEARRVVEFLETIGLLRLTADNRLVPASRRTFDYFFGVLSMIPEVKQYYVVEREGGDVIGVLDDYFVSEYCEVGARFIMGGRPWEVESLTENTVYVRLVDDFGSAVPSWVGEEIPVPFKVAQEVGKIRRRAEEIFREGVKLAEAADIISKEYGVKAQLVEKALRSIYEGVKLGIPAPSDRRMVVEDAGDFIVVHAHFGNRVNRALGKYLAYRLTRLFGAPVYVSEKPYRIVIRTPSVTSEEVAELLLTTSPEEFRAQVSLAVEQSRGFRWRLQQVARRMGVVEPNVRLRKGEVEILVSSLKDTPVYEEALNEALRRDLDVDKAAEIITRINKGEIEVVPARGPSPLTLEHIKVLREGLEPMSPEKRELLSLISFKSRLLQSFVSFCCLDCGAVFEHPVSEVNEDTGCPYCESFHLAFDMIPEEEMAKLARRCLKSRKGRGCRGFKLSAKLYSRYREYAVLARVAGLSFNEAAKLLKKTDKLDRTAFFRQLWLKHREKIRRKASGTS